MYRYESWIIKKTECRRIGAFKLMLRRLLRVPWTARRLNQAILKEINPEYSLGGLMLKLKLKLQYLSHLIWRGDSLEKTLMLGKVEGKRRRGWQRMRWLDGIMNPMSMSLSKLQKIVKGKEGWHAVVHGVTKSQIWLSEWTTTFCLTSNVITMCKEARDIFLKFWLTYNFNFFFLSQKQPRSSFVEFGN